MIHIEFKICEDLSKANSNEIHKNTILTEIETMDINNNADIIDSAFNKMISYELYKGATDYKRNETIGLKQKLQTNKNEEMKNKMDEKRQAILKLREENIKKSKRFLETKQAAEELVRACSGKLENLPILKNDLEAGNYLLKDLKKERLDILEKKRNEFKELKEMKAQISSNLKNYTRELQAKKEKSAEMKSDLEREKEIILNAEKILSRILLLIKRIVPILLPEKKNIDVTLNTLERYTILCGLSLEQKAKILSFRNRNFPIESTNDDDVLSTQVTTLKQTETKEEEEENQNIQKEEEKFLMTARKKIKDPMINLDAKMIEEDDIKKVNEANQDYPLNHNFNKGKSKKGNTKNKRDEIEHNKKDRTKRFLRMQGKHPEIYSLNNNNND